MRYNSINLGRGRVGERVGERVGGGGCRRRVRERVGGGNEGMGGRKEQMVAHLDQNLQHYE